MLAQKYTIDLHRGNSASDDEPPNHGDEPTGTITLLDYLDPRESRQLRADLKDALETGCRVWEFNLDRLESCDASTLGIFLGTHATLKKRAGKLILNVKPNSPVHRLLTLSRLDLVLSVNPF